MTLPGVHLLILSMDLTDERVCGGACMRACMRACVCVWVWVGVGVLEARAKIQDQNLIKIS